MLKLKTILFIALAVTVGGVYAAWSYPTYVGTYSSNVEVPIEIETATEVDVVEGFDAWYLGSNAEIKAGENDLPEVSFDGEFMYNLTYVGGSSVSLDLYVQISIKGLKDYKCGDIQLEAEDIFPSYYHEILIMNDPSETGGEVISDISRIENLLKFSSEIKVDTYEEYQALAACFDDASFEFTFTLK